MHRMFPLRNMLEDDFRAEKVSGRTENARINEIVSRGRITQLDQVARESPAQLLSGRRSKVAPIDYQGESC